ncbi:hypothetical protein NMD70_13525 [Edwardsiella tarda]|nr:hypothetical protein [Edwardsiella tarda]
MLGLSKRGDVYLRTLLIHGARAMLQSVKRKQDAISGWASQLLVRWSNNIASVALANKNRIRRLCGQALSDSRSDRDGENPVYSRLLKERPPSAYSIRDSGVSHPLGKIRIYGCN